MAECNGTSTDNTEPHGTTHRRRRNLNKGEMDPADVAFLAGQTHPTPRASDVAFQSPRGKVEDTQRSREVVEYFVAEVEDFGNRTDSSNNRNKCESNSIFVCFSCNQVGHKAYNCSTKRNEDRKQQRNCSFNKNRTSFWCVSS